MQLNPDITRALGSQTPRIGTSPATHKNMSSRNPVSPAQGELVPGPSPGVDSSTKLPPIPPPLPTRSVRHQTMADQQIKLRSDVSPFIRKLQAAPAGHWFEPDVPIPHVDLWATPTGLYFVYGTLMDPALLTEILDLKTTPKLRPAKVFGYSIKLWGQYPALIEGEPGEEVHGMVFEVAEQRHADRLAEYETKAYRAQPCKIQFTESPENEEVYGNCFMYDGDPTDLDQGDFDLQIWLQRMGRLKKPTTAQ